MPLPAWLAVTIHVPTPIGVIVAPFVPPDVQTLLGLAVKVTGLPEAPPVAPTATGASPSRWLGSVPNVIACGAGLMISVPAA